MTAFIIIAVIFIILIFILATIGNKKQQQREEEYESKMKEEGAVISQHVKCYNGFISIDEENEKIYLALSGIREQKFNSYSFSDILSCEVILDDNSIYKKSTMRTVGGALIGGALLGGAGAIVGGLSGASRKQSNIKKAELKIVVKDISNPNYKFEFYGQGCLLPLEKRNLKKWKSGKILLALL